MQPIIRRTITITITETWTITWADGQETVWHETYEPSQPPAPIAADEHGLITPLAPVQPNRDIRQAQGKIGSNRKA